MQLTEQELFGVMTERFYNYQNSGYAGGSTEQKAFAETLEGFVELYTKGNATIRPKEDPKPTDPRELLKLQLSQATTEGNLEAVTVYSQALQRI